MINISEILKDCPKGTKLYSPLCGECYLDNIDCKYIKVDTPTKEGFYFNPDGTFCFLGEVLLYPSKENRDWDKFQRPFKDGDVVVHTQNNRVIISILKGEEFKDKSIITPYCVFWDKDEGLGIDEPICYYADETRFATEEEKQKLFDAIKANGHKWNAETKTLEKLIVPKFKVGDRIQSKIMHLGNIYTVTGIEESRYVINKNNEFPHFNIDFVFQDDWELVPNKFDIATLKPFDKVLVRDEDSEEWTPNFYGYKREEFQCVLNYWCQCIPYNDDTKHLLGTTDDCDEYYKTW